MKFKEIRILFGINENEYGYSDEELREVEEKLGIELPDSLKSYYKILAGFQSSQQAIFPVICPPNKLNIDKNGYLRLIYDEFTGCYHVMDIVNEKNQIFLKGSIEKGYSSIGDFNTPIDELSAFILPELSRNLQYSACAHLFNKKEIDTILHKYKNKEFLRGLNNQGKFFLNNPKTLISFVKALNRYVLNIYSNNEGNIREVTEQLDFHWSYHNKNG